MEPIASDARHDETGTEEEELGAGFGSGEGQRSGNNCNG
jgi:hypothetical protein